LNLRDHGALTMTLQGVNQSEFQQIVEKRLGRESLDRKAVAKLFESSQGSPLLAAAANQSIREGFVSLEQFRRGFRDFEHKPILGPDGKPYREGLIVPRGVVQSVTSVNQELIERLKAKPESLRLLSSRKFEEVVAELMSRIGFLDVRLTSKIKDKGRDVIAKLAVPTGLLHVIAECKRFAPGNPVGLAIIERFLFTIRDERAAFGLIATTSYFSKGAIAKAQEYASTLRLAEFERIREWLTGGVWHASESGRIWIPPVV